AGAEFQASTKPVFDRLAADPVAGPAVDAIRQLKAATAPSPNAAACDPAAQPSLEPLDTAGFVGTLPPAGTFRVTLTADELAAGGASSGFAANNAGTWNLSFDLDEWSMSSSRSDRPTITCSGTLSSDGTKVVADVAVDNGCGFHDVFLWRETGNGL